MSLPFNPPTPLHDLTPELTETLKARILANLARVVQKTSCSVFYRESPVLGRLRRAFKQSDGVADSISAEGFDAQLQLLLKFYASVPLTSYDDYSPYIGRFSDSPCLLSEVQDLLSPGLPNLIAQSSGTVAGAPRSFLKYPNPKEQYFQWDGLNAPNFKMCTFFGLGLTRVAEIRDGHGQAEVVQEVAVGASFSGRSRISLGIAAKDDEKVIDKKASFSTSPFAVAMLPSYASMILMHAFFGLIDPGVVFMSAPFSTVLYDAVRTIEANWTSFVGAIEEGTLPEIAGIDYYRRYLESYVEPNPGRAHQLRAVDVGKEGWLKEVWPHLSVVRTALSGAYGAPLPKLLHHFGFEVNFQSAMYTSAEVLIGMGYDANDTNLYRLEGGDHFEFLDVRNERSRDNLCTCQVWEVVTGGKYEVVATTNDGLWRYMMEDIVEIAGFDPVDGQPLLRFSGRRNDFRIAEENLTESMLCSAIAASEKSLGPVVEFTTVIDSRQTPPSYGFLVEIEGDIGSESAMALAEIRDYLLTDESYRKCSDKGSIGDPTIRILLSDTFKKYRGWKSEDNGLAPGNVQVPIMSTNFASREWFSQRVVYEVVM